LAAEAAHQALMLAEKIDDQSGIACGQMLHAWLSLSMGDYLQAVNYGKQALEGFRSLEFNFAIAWALTVLIEARLYLQDDENIEFDLNTYLKMGQELSDRWMISVALFYRAVSLVNQEKYYDGLQQMAEVIRIQAEEGYKAGVCWGLLWKAYLWQILEDEDQKKISFEEFFRYCQQEWNVITPVLPMQAILKAVVLLVWEKHPAFSVQVMSRLAREVRKPLFPFEKRYDDLILSKIRAAMGEKAFEAAWKTGQSLDLKRAWDVAVGRCP
jgi:hypothetical protein